MAQRVVLHYLFSFLHVGLEFCSASRRAVDLKVTLLLFGLPAVNPGSEHALKHLRMAIPVLRLTLGSGILAAQEDQPSER